jgi:hypothetical protein
VLALDGHRRKSFAAEGFGDERIGQAAPAAEYGFSGAQPASKCECGDGHACAAFLAGDMFAAALIVPP